VVRFDLQAGAIELSGRVPLPLLLAVVLLVSVPLAIGWIWVARQLRAKARTLLDGLRIRVWQWLLRHPTDRDDRPC
jgi:hypothetical protein